MHARVMNAGEGLVEPLTRREREILGLLAQGCSAPEIARQLTLALSSVKWYVQQIYGKLGVHNKQQAIIRAGELELLETHAPAAYALIGPKHNLPYQLTSFIGRDKEIETIQHLLAPDGGSRRSTLQNGRLDRLITLTGAGGSGKTRLSLQVAFEALDIFPDGVWFIDLAPLTDPALVPQTLLTTLGLREQADIPSLVIVSNYLQAKRALLILDNCEHLVQTCAQLAERLLHACPALHILATSREALSVPGEKLYLVPTLTTPDPAQADLDALPQYEAVRLFVERAQTALPGFELTTDNTLAVAQVCYQLDGIPLAIELAAARVKALRVEQIAARLENRFELLIGGSRTALLRHQTLHALIEWSHDLLLEPERVLFRRLAVFAGGWTVEAAEGVCAGGGVERDAVLNLLTHLVNKSLLLAEREQGQEARYRMLETIRQYASERLLQAGEGDRLRSRHVDFFLQWAERMEPLVRGPQQLECLDQIEAEHDNLRVALEWSLTRTEHGEASRRLAGALPVFWNQRGYINEGLAWLEKALSSQNVTPAGGVRAKALYGAGFLACWQGDRMDAARAWLEESASLWRMLGPAGRTGLVQALTMLSEAMRILGDPAAARPLAEEAAAISREQNERWGLAFALTNLGIVIREQEDFGLARATIDESIALWRELGDLWGLDLATHRLGELAHRQGDYEGARRHFMDCLMIARKLGDQEQVAWKLANLAMVALNLGDFAEAKAYTEEYFSLFRELGSRYGLSYAYYDFGLLALMDGDHRQAQSFFEQALKLARTSGPFWLGAIVLMGLAGATAGTQAWRAAQLLGAAEARLTAGASYWDAFEKLCVGRLTVTAIAKLGDAAFAAARAEGRAMTFEQAADYALEDK